MWSSPPMAAPISSICRTRIARWPRRVVDLLLAQDYVSGLFVDDDLGDVPGHAAAVGDQSERLGGDAAPAIVVNFRSFSTGCAEPVLCTVEIADTGLQQGQGMHGSFSRADTMNFMAAIGPDFKTGFVDEAPVSNADVGKTLAQPARPQDPDKGKLMGRVIEEALPGGAHAARRSRRAQSPPSADGPADRAGVSAGRIHAVFRCRRISGPHGRA